MNAQKSYTINKAQERMAELKREIDYLEILTDEKVRKDIELYLEQVPDSLLPLFTQELDERRKELLHLDVHIKSVMESFLAIPAYVPGIYTPSAGVQYSDSTSHLPKPPPQPFPPECKRGDD